MIFNTEFLLGGNINFTCKDKGKEIGLLQARISGNHCCILAVDVDENHQKKGIATSLYRKMKDLLSNEGLTFTGSLEGSGPIQIREKIFDNNQYFCGMEEIELVEAKRIMDVEFGRIIAKSS